VKESKGKIMTNTQTKGTLSIGSIFGVFSPSVVTLALPLGKKMFLTSGLAEDSNFPLEQLSAICGLERHCFQTNGFSPYMTKTDQIKQCHCFQS